MKVIILLLFNFLWTQSQLFTGTYEFKSEEPSENHYIVLTSGEGKLKGKYYGSEDGKGHGIFFYKADLSNIRLFANGNIEFEIGERVLFEKSLFTVKNTSPQSAIGNSRDPLRYKGTIAGNKITLICQSESDECWKEELVFLKIK
ncbi:MAG: hypothetical protein HOP08_10175 [Cyclobacteriaceae bacterium]|nr:hypothetical protein [Cyclobacteriaceae bacterium]